jgi:hypothetical protein
MGARRLFLSKGYNYILYTEVGKNVMMDFDIEL